MEKKLSEEKIKEIETKSKELLIEFNRKLEKIKFEEKDVSPFKQKGRKETNKKNLIDDFREIFLKNAPEKNENSIIAERGSWK